MKKNIEFVVDKWENCKEKMRWLWNMHWEEVALNKNCIPLNIDEEVFDNLDKQNSLHILLVKDDDKVVGYYIAILRKHLHYAHSLTAFTDAYYLHPNYRKGFNGVNLFKYAEKTLKEAGVERIIMQTKLNRENNKKLDKGIIFKKLGFIKAEVVYTKTLI